MAKKKRKTREEKIIADLRRELQAVHREFKDPLPEKKTHKSIKKKKELLEPALPTADKANPYLRKDLTKSLILAIMTIAFEIVIYSFILPGGKLKFF